jgi:hypothetical protein
MYLETEKLIDGVMTSLREDVLPDLATARARGRVWAILDILNNLRDRIEPRCESAQAECESARDAIAGCAAVLRAGSRHADADRLMSLLSEADKTAPDLHARVAALRAVVVEAVGLARAIDDVAQRQAAFAPLESHIAMQSMRDLTGLKVSLLSEISKG